MPRTITYREAISEAFVQGFAQDLSLFMMGCGVTDPKGIFGTTVEVAKQFGAKRVFDVPLSENAITGIAIGAAICGLHAVLVHQRSDFLLLTMDQIVNNAAKWKYMSGGKLSVPVVIRSIVGRGWGQSAQHSQNLHVIFAHIPGLKVVLPSDAYDAKGLMLTSLRTNSPVIFIEHRWLHETVGEVPEPFYFVPFGKAAIKREGEDLTIIAISHMVAESMKAAKELEKEGISVEVCDPRTLSPLDSETIFNSVAKTGRLLIVDAGWKTFGASAELVAQGYEKLGGRLKAPICRIALPDAPTPCSSSLEQKYYPSTESIIQAAKRLCSGVSMKKMSKANLKPVAGQREFVGPF